MNMKNKAFTLAEVLITLGIIGIVAALTMPSLIGNYRKIVLETKLKKYYTVISQATKSAESKHGTMRNWDFTTASAVFDKYYRPELQIIKHVSPYSSEAYFVLSDGTCGYFRLNGDAMAKNYYWGINVNCCKGPHGQGVGEFEFSQFNVISSGIRCNYGPSGCGWPEEYPDGGYNPQRAKSFDSSTCTASGSASAAWKSYQCFHKIMHDGFKIKDDYNFEQQPKGNFCSRGVQNGKSLW